MNSDYRELDPLDQALLNRYQRELILISRPFDAMAEDLQISVEEVLERLKSLQARGFISRIGPIFRPHALGVSTLAAMSVPPEHLEKVAAEISQLPEVNHNYEREHSLNLWFVLTASDEKHLCRTLASIEEKTGMKVHDLRLLREFRIDLGFDLEPQVEAGV